VLTAAGRPAPSPLEAILFGTGTNYLKVALRLIGGLFTFRLLFQALPAQDFGFYQLLWSTFGYVVLFDFGFGVSLQRAMAMSLGAGEAARRDRREVLSTVFFSCVALDLAIAAALYFGGHRLLHGLAFDGGAATDKYRTVAFLFALGMLAAFPFGIFREVLRGLNRLHVTNLIELPFVALQAVLIAWGCVTGASLTWLMGAAVACVVLPIWTCALVCLRDPDLRPRLRDFRLGRLREIGSFSLIAYLGTMTGLVLAQSDQLVIGAMVSVQAVALYVPGAKLTQSYGMLAMQLQDTLGPVAARLGRLGDAQERSAALRQLLLTSQRWALLAGTLLVIPLLASPRGALAVITGQPAAAPEMLQTAVLLVASVYFGIAGASCTKRILFMIGHHRATLLFSLAEAGLNLGLSLYWCWSWKSGVGAPAGTLVATVCVSLVALPVHACRTLGVSPREFLLEACGRALLANAGALAAAAIYWGLLPPAAGVVHFLAGCALCAAAGLPGWWLVGMLDDERSRVLGALRRGLPARTPTEQ